jgi:hypothetical protein
MNNSDRDEDFIEALERLHSFSGDLGMVGKYFTPDYNFNNFQVDRIADIINAFGIENLIRALVLSFAHTSNLDYKNVLAVMIHTIHNFDDSNLFTLCNLILQSRDPNNQTNPLYLVLLVILQFVGDSDFDFSIEKTIIEISRLGEK